MTVTTLVWVDGIRAEPGARHLSALDRGFTLADGLFETLRISNGVAFRPGAHLGRMHASALRLGLSLPPDLARMVERAAREATDAGVRDAGLRLTVSRGVSPPGLTPAPGTLPTCVITISTRPPAPGEGLNGLSARVASGRRNEHSMTAGMKTLAYTESVMALAEARSAGADEAILLDTDGHLSEASASNIFLARGGALFTPPLSCAALPGITRAVVREIADAEGIDVLQHPLGLDDLIAADEAFLTSSLRGIAPLVSIDARRIGGGSPGRLTNMIASRYLALVDEECVEWPSVAQ